MLSFWEEVEFQADSEHSLAPSVSFFKRQDNPLPPGSYEAEL